MEEALDNVVCPYCQAPKGGHCVTNNGKRYGDKYSHNERWWIAKRRLMPKPELRLVSEQ